MNDREKLIEFVNLAETAKERLRMGWSEEKALTTPVRKRTKGYRPSQNSGAKMDA